MTTPKLIECTTRPQLDPYHANTGGETYTQFFIDLRDGHYGIVQEMDDNATPTDEWHGIVQTAGLGIRPDESEARAYLESDAVVALLQRVLDGGEVDWDGSNMVGSLDDDAQDALHALIDELGSLPETDWTLWAVDEWLDGDDQGVTAETTNAEIERIAAGLRDLARSDHVTLAGDVADHLYQIREDALESSLLSLAHAARLTGLDSSHLRRLIRDGKLTAGKPGHDWIIAAQDLRGLLRVKSGRPRKAAPNA